MEVSQIDGDLAARAGEGVGEDQQRSSERNIQLHPVGCLLALFDGCRLRERVCVCVTR